MASSFAAEECEVGCILAEVQSLSSPQATEYGSAFQLARCMTTLSSRILMAIARTVPTTAAWAYWPSTFLVLLCRIPHPKSPDRAYTSMQIDSRKFEIIVDSI